MMTSFENLSRQKSIDYLKAIGDVSMGDTGKFNSLALAFCTDEQCRKVDGPRTLCKWIVLGFNPLEEISRKTGKSIGGTKMRSKGAITSKMVQDAFISATSAGEVSLVCLRGCKDSQSNFA